LFTTIITTPHLHHHSSYSSSFLIIIIIIIIIITINIITKLIKSSIDFESAKNYLLGNRRVEERLECKKTISELKTRIEWDGGYDRVVGWVIG